MSSFSKSPIVVPLNIEIKFDKNIIYIKGKNGELVHTIHESISVQYINNKLVFNSRKNYNRNNVLALIGTTRALLNNMLIGVNNNFTKRLQLIGIGYRVLLNNNTINLFLGFSHIINYILPVGIIAECPNQTEIILKGPNKQIVGQTAADIRAYRCPEPYKGKGIRYFNEIIYLKEAKKK